MKKSFTLCLATSLVLPALIVLWLHSVKSTSAEKAALPPLTAATRSHAAGDAATTRETRETAEKTAAFFAAKMDEWEQARYPLADQIEEQLRSLITDQNAAAIARALSARHQTTYLGLLVQERWAQVDRKAALLWLEQQPSATPLQITAMLRGWIAIDSGSMNSYLQDLPAGSWKNHLLAAAARDATEQKYPEQALVFLAGLPAGDERTRLTTAAILDLSEWNAPAALDAVETLPDPAMQEKMIANVALGYAIHQPEQAADWILQSLPPGEACVQATASVIQLWASQHNGADAAAWVEKQPDPETRKAAVAALVTSWGEYNQQAVRAWAQTLPEGELRQEAHRQIMKLAAE